MTPMFPAVGADGKIQEAHLPERLQEANLLVDIRREAAAAGVASPGLDLLAFKLAFGGSGNHTVAVVADSTMNDSNDSIRIFDRKYSTQLADSVRHVYHNWNTSDDGWRHTVNQEGSITPGHDGTILEDSFNRVVTDLVGSTPDKGAAWSGSPGIWSSTGTEAKASGLGTLSVDAGAKNMMVESTLNVTTEALTTAQSFRYYLGASHATSEQGIMAAINISNTGNFSVTPYVNLGGGPTRAGDVLNAPGVSINSGTPVQVTLRIEIDIQNVVITVIGPTGESTTDFVITEDQYALVSTWVVLKSFSSNTPGLGIDHMKISTAPQPPVGDTLDVWNGAIAGGRWSTFSDAKLDQMFGGLHVDVLMLSMGHNNGPQSGPDFVSETEAWVDLWMSKHPETQGIVWVSQNPQFSPASNAPFHRDRQMAMRFAAKQHGWEYVSGFEAFSTRPDGGRSLVGADGIHPTTPPTGVLTGDYGAVLVAETILGAVHARI